MFVVGLSQRLADPEVIIVFFSPTHAHTLHEIKENKQYNFTLHVLLINNHSFNVEIPGVNVVNFLELLVFEQGHVCELCLNIYDPQMLGEIFSKNLLGDGFVEICPIFHNKNIL